MEMKYLLSPMIFEYFLSILNSEAHQKEQNEHNSEYQQSLGCEIPTLQRR